MNGTRDRCGVLLMEWSSRTVVSDVYKSFLYSDVNIALVFRRQCRSCIQLCQHELEGHRAEYESQVSVYVRAIARATGKPARGVLLSV